MKRISLLFLSLLLLVLVFTSCGDTQIKVNFVVDGNVYQTVQTTGREPVTMPTNPKKDGFSFDGWYFDNDSFSDPFESNSLIVREINGDISVYAKWTEKRPYERVDEDTVLFGSYPQTEVVDKELKTALDKLAGKMPTSENAQGWTSYEYYLNGTVKSFMWYKDVEKDGAKYRGVYFTAYRPGYVNSKSTNNSYQSANGYFTSTVYWFLYEPISWTVLEETDGKVMILCDMIIDSQNYYTDVKPYKVNDKDVYTNNYERSTIRKWLNDDFYNTAFDQLQKEIILTTNVHNLADRTDSPKKNTYACGNTKDKIFLLSYAGAKAHFKEAENRQKKPTDYAQSQGAFTDTASGTESGYWWLRSPSSHDSFAVSGVYSSGNLSYGNVADSSYGVVPCLWLKLN